jgi:hypothetical protein
MTGADTMTAMMGSNGSHLNLNETLSLSKRYGQINVNLIRPHGT